LNSEEDEIGKEQIDTNSVCLHSGEEVGRASRVVLQNTGNDDTILWLPKVSENDENDVQELRSEPVRIADVGNECRLIALSKAVPTNVTIDNELHGVEDELAD